MLSCVNRMHMFAKISERRIVSIQTETFQYPNDYYVGSFHWMLKLAELGIIQPNGA